MSAMGSETKIPFLRSVLQGFWVLFLVLAGSLFAAVPALEHEPPAGLTGKSPGVQITQDAKGITYQATTRHTEAIPGGEQTTTILQLTRRHQSGAVTDITEKKIEKMIQNDKDPGTTESITIKTVRQTDEKGQMSTTTTKQEKYSGPDLGEGTAKSETRVLPPVSKTTDHEGKEIYYYNEEGTQVRETHWGDGRVDISFQNKDGKSIFAETHRYPDGSTTVLRHEGKVTHIERYDPAGTLIEKQGVLADGKRVRTKRAEHGEETVIQNAKGQILKQIKRHDDGTYAETLYEKGQPLKIQDFDRDGKLLRTHTVTPRTLKSKASREEFPEA